MTTTLKYNLQQIADMSYSGFKFEIPEDTYNMINYLSTQVGSVVLASKTFVKPKLGRERENIDLSINDADNGFSSNIKNKKKKSGRGMEASSEEWETIRSFQTTKIEQKSGIDGDIDHIRLLLNKLTDKTFLDMREKIFERLNKVCSEFENEEGYTKIATTIYDFCSTNKFYSKIFADLFAELCGKYTWIVPIFNEKYDNIMSQYSDIHYVDSEKDYDGFCDMNKKNDRRRSVTTFLMSLANNGFIKKEGVVNILRNLLELVCNLIDKVENKNEVDELTENIAILFNKDIVDEVSNNNKVDNNQNLHINGKTIVATVNSLAKSKSKDHPSLSNKAIFKFMDLIEM
jgi:hypothetical protein